MCEECSQYGRIYHSEIEPQTMGYVYLMFATTNGNEKIICRM